MRHRHIDRRRARHAVSLEDLEERVAPAHLAPVQVVELPPAAAEHARGIATAQEANHGRVNFSGQGVKFVIRQFSRK